MQHAPLPLRSVMSLSGPDTIAFLQGLVTADVENLAVGEGAHAALLTPQGKVLFDFLLVRTGDEAVLLDTPTQAIDELYKRLMFYRLRSMVAIDLRRDLSVYAYLDLDGADVVPGEAHYADPRDERMGVRVYRAHDAAAAVDTDLPTDAYHARRIACGLAEAPDDYAYGELFPHDIGMDKTGGVDFNKGCYVGQEVVSRMQHRGTARRRIVHVSLEGASPAQGTAITFNDVQVGTLGSHSGQEGLAIVRIDKIEQAMANREPLSAADTKLIARRAAWLETADPPEETSTI